MCMPCIYNQPSESLAHIFLWITRLNPITLKKKKKKTHIENTNDLSQYSFSSVSYLIELDLSNHSP